MTSIFTRLPQDMLQHEINHYLDPMSRLSWNIVLRGDERVYRKFPNDYMIRHQMLVSYTAYHIIADELTYHLYRLKGVQSINKSAKLLKRLITFFNVPQNQYVIKYVCGLKNTIEQMLGNWTEDDNELYEYLPENVVDALKALATDSLKVIKAISYERKIGIKGHVSIYGV